MRKEVATIIGKWFEEYATVWRKHNKEGVLFRIFELFEYYCRELWTKFEETSKDLSGIIS